MDDEELYQAKLYKDYVKYLNTALSEGNLAVKKPTYNPLLDRASRAKLSLIDAIRFCDRLEHNKHNKRRF